MKYALCPSSPVCSFSILRTASLGSCSSSAVTYPPGNANFPLNGSCFLSIRRIWWSYFVYSASGSTILVTTAITCGVAGLRLGWIRFGCIHSLPDFSISGYAPQSSILYTHVGSPLLLPFYIIARRISLLWNTYPKTTFYPSSQSAGPIVK